MENRNPFSPSGTLRRMPYFLTQLILGILIAALSSSAGSAAQTGSAAFLPALFLMLAALLCFFASAKRCRDIGISPWFILLLLIPVADFFFGLYLIFRRGKN